MSYEKLLYRPCPHPACNGSGDIICLACDQRGLAPKKPCPDCQGKGFRIGPIKGMSMGVTVSTCVTCNGTGIQGLSKFKTYLIENFNFLKEFHFKKCPKCNGKKLTTCPTCEGAGEIVNDNPCKKCKGAGCQFGSVGNGGTGIVVATCSRCHGTCTEENESHSERARPDLF
ncbi:hypothetical protein ACFL08_00915 [Patescibacteria group bacterium]